MPAFAWHVPVSPRSVGLMLGLGAAWLVLALTGGHRPVAPPTGPILSECDGQIESVVIQYVHGADFAIPIYRQFLQALPADVRVYAVTPDRGAFDELQAVVGANGNRLTPVLTGHAMTAWSRDRWIALRPGPEGRAMTLLAPQTENGSTIWPARLGDQRIADDLAGELSPEVAASHAGFYFDGGDFLADSRCVFVTPGVIRRNLQVTVHSLDELRDLISKTVHRRVILLEHAPDHHAGMFMMAAGDNTVIVGDPSLAKSLLDPIDLPGGADFSAATQARFDSVASAATGAGYRVIRIPVAPAGDGKTFITYLNAIIDQRAGVRTIYLPQYQDEPRLNQAGREVWESLGYRVIPIDVTSAFRYFGTLHCLVNVVDKK